MHETLQTQTRAYIYDYFFAVILARRRIYFLYFKQDSRTLLEGLETIFYLTFIFHFHLDCPVARMLWYVSTFEFYADMLLLDLWRHTCIKVSFSWSETSATLKLSVMSRQRKQRHFQTRMGWCSWKHLQRLVKIKSINQTWPPLPSLPAPNIIELSAWICR